MNKPIFVVKVGSSNHPATKEDIQLVEDAFKKISGIEVVTVPHDVEVQMFERNNDIGLVPTPRLRPGMGPGQ